MTTNIIPEDILICKIYVFVNRAGDRCELYSGFQSDGKRHYSRYMIKGNRIPFPVWNGTWFVGIPIREMNNFMADMGYRLIATVNVNGLPTWQFHHKHYSKGNENLNRR